VAGCLCAACCAQRLLAVLGCAATLFVRGGKSPPVCVDVSCWRSVLRPALPAQAAQVQRGTALVCAPRSAVAAGPLHSRPQQQGCTAKCLGLCLVTHSPCRKGCGCYGGAHQPPKGFYVCTATCAAGLAAGDFVIFFMGGEGWRGRGEEGRRRVAQRGREGGMRL
jgi:hypothetical protein